MRKCVIVTGLPASGKTTIAQKIAEDLGFSCLDKDNFLEDLYERQGVRSWDDRKRLSRLSDIAFKNAAIQSEAAVLTSHWRPLGANDESGTPSDWVNEEFEVIVEVCCRCTCEEAQRRFIARTRHSGHLDQERDTGELAYRLKSWEDRFPLGIGTLVDVRTDAEVNVSSVIERVQKALTNDP